MSETGAGWDDRPAEPSVEQSTVPPSVDSNWWWGVAAVPIWIVIGVMMLFASILLMIVVPEAGIMIGFLFLIVWALGAAVLDLLIVIAIYFDARAVEDAGVEWETTGDTYLMIAAIGLMVPMIHTVLSLYYLHQRRQYVGVP